MLLLIQSAGHSYWWQSSGFYGQKLELYTQAKHKQLSATGIFSRGKSYRFNMQSTPTK